MTKNSLEGLIISSTGGIILPSPNESVFLYVLLALSKPVFYRILNKTLLHAVAVTFLSDHSFVIQKSFIFVRF